MIYEYRGPGAPKGISARAAGSELQRIYEAHGELTPSAIVDESRASIAPLHSAFEWDDAEAAEQYREQQARMLVRSVVLVPEPEKNEVVPIVRAFISLTAPAGGTARTYRPIMEAMANPTEADEIKRRLRNELLSMRRRYIDLLDLDEILSQAQAVLVA